FHQRRWFSMTKTGIVIGVSGQIGLAVARRMLSDGWSVRGLHNGNTALPDDLAEVDVVVGDRNDDAALASVLSGGVDGVVDTIAFTSAHAQQLLRSADVIGALAVISSVAVYADADGHSIGNGGPRWPTAIKESQALKRVLDDRRILPLKFRGLSRFHPSTTA